MEICNAIISYLFSAGSQQAIRCVGPIAGISTIMCTLQAAPHEWLQASFCRKAKLQDLQRRITKFAASKEGYRPHALTPLTYAYSSPQSNPHVERSPPIIIGQVIPLLYQSLILLRDLRVRAQLAREGNWTWCRLSRNQAVTPRSFLENNAS